MFDLLVGSGDGDDPVVASGSGILDGNAAARVRPDLANTGPSLTNDGPSSVFRDCYLCKETLYSQQL